MKTLAHLAAAALLALTTQSALACEHGDCWGERHVWFHFGGEAAIGAVAQHFVDDKPTAFALTLGVGVVREEYKRSLGFAHYQPSRVAADVLGSAVGVWVPGLFIEPKAGGAAVSYAWNY